MKYHKIQISLFLLLLMTVAGNSQSNAQNRNIIDQDESRFGLINEENNNHGYFNLEETKDGKVEILLTPIITYSILKNNPKPWYIRDNFLYYISMDVFFKHSYSLRIHALSMDEKDKFKNDLKEILLLAVNPDNQIFLSEMHNRRFNEDHLEEFFYDFTVRKSKSIILISYFENKICVYESLATENKLGLCSCEELKLSPPFQVFEDNNELFILDNKNNLINLTLHQSGKISIRKEEDRNVLMPEGTLLIKNN